MSKAKYILDVSLTVLREDNFGHCEGTTKLINSCCEISKEESAKVMDFLVANELHELKKAKVKISYG